MICIYILPYSKFIFVLRIKKGIKGWERDEVIWSEGGERMGGMVVAELGGGEGGERECILGYEMSSLPVVWGVGGGERRATPHLSESVYRLTKYDWIRLNLLQ